MMILENTTLVDAIEEMKRRGVKTLSGMGYKDSADIGIYLDTAKDRHEKAVKYAAEGIEGWQYDIDHENDYDLIDINGHLCIIQHFKTFSMTTYGDFPTEDEMNAAYQDYENREMAAEIALERAASNPEIPYAVWYAIALREVEATMERLDAEFKAMFPAETTTEEDATEYTREEAEKVLQESEEAEARAQALIAELRSTTTDTNTTEENTMNTFIKDVKADIIDRLEDMRGTDCYLCDVGFELTISENNTGSWYCSSFQATEDIKDNFELFGHIAEEMRDNWEDTTNPLLDPERFHVKAMIYLYEAIFNAAVSDFDEWNDEITIDDDFIERVREALEAIDADRLF